MARVNYIHRLEQTVTQLQHERDENGATVAELRRYLHSSKFWTDTTVQVGDVLAYLDRLELPRP